MKYNVEIWIALAIQVRFKGSRNMSIFHIFNWNIFLSNHLAGHSHYCMKQCIVQDSYMAIWGILLCECSIWECMSKPWVNHRFVQEMFHERSVFPNVHINSIKHAYCSLVAFTLAGISGIQISVFTSRSKSWDFTSVDIKNLTNYRDQHRAANRNTSYDYLGISAIIWE